MGEARDAMSGCVVLVVVVSYSQCLGVYFYFQGSCVLANLENVTIVFEIILQIYYQSASVFFSSVFRNAIIMAKPSERRLLVLASCLLHWLIVTPEWPAKGNKTLSRRYNLSPVINFYINVRAICMFVH